jgi:trimeric autotransporter adhesin
MLRRNSIIVFVCLVSLALLLSCKGFFVSGDALQTLSISPGSTLTSTGQTLTFKANGTTVDGNAKDVTSTATWRSSDTRVATTTAGSVTTLAAGATAITAESDGVTGQVVVTVTASPLQSLSITPASPTVLLSQGTQQFTATGTLQDGSTVNLTNSVSWSSGTTSVATINSSGLASLLTSGTTTIKATINTTPALTDQPTTTMTVQ